MAEQPRFSQRATHTSEALYLLLPFTLPQHF